jgi:ElaB/YqjD/DUF883 family membrane-anchored ribosome-binding protein
MTTQSSSAPSPSDSSASSTAAATIDELRTLILEAEQALANAGDAADDKLVGIRDRLQSVIDESKSALSRFRKTAQEQARKADALVRSHPYQAIGVALGVGALLGFLLSSRRK